MEKITAIVLAAGKGSRMQSDIPKQFMNLCGKPVVYYSLKVFSECEKIDEIVLVTGKDDLAYCREQIVDKYNLHKVISVVEGGNERYWSVRNGLEAAKGSDYVLIHDAARPCITREMIERSIVEVMQYNACTVGVPVKDTIKVVDKENFGIDTPSRSTLWQIQTPQSFSYSQLLNAYFKLEQDGATDITDDTMIVERYLGVKVKVIPGDYRNMKITTPEDLQIAENFVNKAL